MSRAARVLTAAVAASLLLAAPATAATNASAQDDRRFGDLDHAEALAAANSAFPLALREEPGPVLPPTVDRVRGFASNSAALIDTGGHRGLLLSNAPLAAPDAGGTLRLMDLDIAERGRVWRPGRGLVATEIDPATGAFELTAAGGPEIRVRPLGVPSDAQGSVIEGKGFVSNSRTDADTLLQATPSGLETFEQLRSVDAPTRLRWSIDLPDGSRAQRTPTGIVFRDSTGHRLLVVRAPWAVDAAGRDVPIGLTYDAGVLEMVVHHDTPGVTYPVLADPTWDTHYDLTDPSIGTQGFFERDEQAGTPGYELSVDDSGYGAGLFVYPRGGGAYPNPPDGEEVRGSIFFRAPGTTRLKQAIWRGVRYRLEQRDCGPPVSFENKRQFLRFTLSLSGQASVERQIGPDGTHDELTEESDGGRTIMLTDAAADPTGTNASMAMWTDVTGANVPFIARNPGTGGCRAGLIDPYAQAERIDLVLTDIETPTISEISGPLMDAATDLDAAWLSAPEAEAGAPLTGKIEAIDPGSGVSDVLLTATNSATGSKLLFRTHDPGELCDPTHNTPDLQGRLCPEVDRWILGADDPFALDALAVQEGRWDLNVLTTDRSGQSTESGAWSYYVDTTPPEVSALALKTPPQTDDKAGSWIRANQPDQDLEIAMVGTDPPSRTPDGTPTGTLSGVRGYKLEFTPQGTATEPLIPRPDVPAEQCGPPSPVPFGEIAAPCPSTGPTQTAVLARDLAEGQATVAAEVRDHAGNTGAPREESVWVDNTRPALSATGRIADLDDTWLNPSGTLDLDATATDADGSGVARITTRVQTMDGTALEPPDGRDTCPSPNAGAAPEPICPPTAAMQTVLAADDLPDGDVQVLVDAEDAVTNATEERRGQLDYRLHVDRIAPKVTLSGEAADLAATGYWTNPGATLQATVTATDEGAGIKTLELWARDDNGERQLATQTVCQPEEPATGNRPPCPLRAQADFEIPTGAIADGSIRLEARAVEYTGRLARAREDLFIDTTAPNAPRQVTVRRVLGSLATVAWERPPPPPDSSGISMYEYAVIYAGHSEIVWNRTPYQGVQLTGLPPGVDIQVLVRTIDGVGLPSTPAVGFAQAAVVIPRIGLLDKYEKFIKGLPGRLFPLAGGLFCGEIGLCSFLPGRDSYYWLAGEVLSGVVFFGDIRDALIAVFKGDLTETGLSLAGLVPVGGDALKSAKSIRKWMKRTKKPLHDVMNVVARVGGPDGTFTRQVLDHLTDGAYGQMRRNALSHDDVHELAKAGNDLRKLGKHAQLARRPLSNTEIDAVEDNLRTHWPGRASIGGARNRVGAPAHEARRQGRAPCERTSRPRPG